MLLKFKNEKCGQVKRMLALAIITGTGCVSAADAQPKPGRPAAVERVVVRDREPDSEQPIAFSRCPREVRQSVREMGHDGDVLAAYLLKRGGEEYYRLTIQTFGPDRIILAESNGRIVNVEDVRPEDEPFYRNHANAWYKDYDDRMTAQRNRVIRQVEVVTATVDRPERITWAQVPGSVRATCMREAAGDSIEDPIRYRTNDNKVIYQTLVDIGRGRKHLLQVLPDGRIFNEGEYTAAGKVKDEEWRAKSVGFRDIPRYIQREVERLAPTGRIPHVDIVNRRGAKIYTIHIELKDGTRYLSLNEEAEVLSDVSDRWDTKEVKGRRQ